MKISTFSQFFKKKKKIFKTIFSKNIFLQVVFSSVVFLNTFTSQNFFIHSTAKTFVDGLVRQTLTVASANFSSTRKA